MDILQTNKCTTGNVSHGGLIQQDYITWMLFYYQVIAIDARDGFNKMVNYFFKICSCRTKSYDVIQYSQIFYTCASIQHHFHDV